MPPRKSSAKQPRRKNPVKRPRGKRSVKQATHYEILSVEPNATYEEICAAYLSATTITDSAADDDDEKSLAVQKAFQVLSDTQWRAEYDEELPAARRRRNARVIEEINLMNVGFMVDVKRRHVIELLYPCLCESCYSIDSTDLAKMGYKLCRGFGSVWFEAPEAEEDDADDDRCMTLGSVVMPCKSCSLGVRFTI
ncbi:unnamed protein product [Linum tenue]|uniref:J domain-containing protein n=1 Tax=Linum tenue TaxID=586396 RepID=A0AAV0RNW4_9ROSI|nr:unnamed protein product [Linum tenue]